MQSHFYPPAPHPLTEIKIETDTLQNKASAEFWKWEEKFNELLGLCNRLLRGYRDADCYEAGLTISLLLVVVSFAGMFACMIKGSSVGLGVSLGSALLSGITAVHLMEKHPNLTWEMYTKPACWQELDAKLSSVDLPSEPQTESGARRLRRICLHKKTALREQVYLLFSLPRVLSDNSTLAQDPINIVVDYLGIDVEYKPQDGWKIR